MRAAGPDKTDPNIVFHGLLFSSLPEPEKSTDRLTQEGEDLIIAGQDTTGKLDHQPQRPAFFSA